MNTVNEKRVVRVINTNWSFNWTSDKNGTAELVVLYDDNTWETLFIYHDYAECKTRFNCNKHVVGLTKDQLVERLLKQYNTKKDIKGKFVNY